MHAIGYVRVSTEDQAREGVSLDHQEAKINGYAALNDLPLAEIIRDEGLSGQSLERKGIKRLLELVQQNEIKAVIVYKLDRLSRKTLDTLNLIELFEAKGVAFHSISEKVDTQSATGRFFLTIISALAQMERDLIAERTREALQHKRTQNEWLGRIPFGFKIDPAGHLVEDPAQVKVIRKAKRLRNAGRSMRDIAAALNLSVGYVHKILNVHFKSVKAAYCKG